jgi:hypothetical protein
MRYIVLGAVGYKQNNKQIMQEAIDIQQQELNSAKELLDYRKRLKKETGYNKVFLTYKRK